MHKLRSPPANHLLVSCRKKVWKKLSTFCTLKALDAHEQQADATQWCGRDETPKMVSLVRPSCSCSARGWQKQQVVTRKTLQDNSKVRLFGP